jgi:hypothetical protein
MAFTLARLAQVLGETDRVRGHLERALEVAERLGARPLVERIAAELGQAPAPVAHAAASRPGGAERPGPSARRNVQLIPAGDFWQVRFAGGEAAVKDSKGVQILARLLGDPEREFHALDLNVPAGAAIVETVDGGGLAGLDEQARADYRRRLAEIAEVLDEARAMSDVSGVEMLLEEQEALQRELTRAFGLGGRQRASGSAAERARVNVTRRIRDAIEKIGEHLPDAARYLDNTIKTGTYCKYTPL